MKFLIAFWLFIAATTVFILTNCGSIDSQNPTPLIRAKEVVIRYGPVPESNQGYTYSYGDTAAIHITRRELLAEKQLQILITHELFHALGYVGHIINRNDCIFSKRIALSTEEFCDEDIKLLLAVSNSWKTLVTSTSELEEETKFAIDKINKVNNILEYKE